MRIVNSGINYDYLQLLFMLSQQQCLGYLQNIELLTSPTISFPAQDIQKVAITDNQVKVYLSFLGLFGVDTTLPQQFIKLACTDNQQGAYFRDFMAIFNQRFYELYYLAWQKYRPIKQNDLNKYSYYLNCIGGDISHESLLENRQLSGVWNQYTNNRSGLLAIVRSCFPESNITLDENIISKSYVDIPFVLGIDSSNQLGITALLGEHINDASSKINIIIELNHLEKAADYHLALDKINKLKGLITNYLGGVVNAKLNLKVNNISKNHLGKSLIILGLSSMLSAF